jgi:hypothetical protein
VAQIEIAQQGDLGAAMENLTVDVKNQGPSLSVNHGLTNADRQP